jgi:hypothetical protein
MGLKGNIFLQQTNEMFVDSNHSILIPFLSNITDQYAKAMNP